MQKRLISIIKTLPIGADVKGLLTIGTDLYQALDTPEERKFALEFVRDRLSQPDSVDKIREMIQVLSSGKYMKVTDWGSFGRTLHLFKDRGN